MDPVAAADLLGSWGYPALFVLLILTAAGSPLPEDLLLVTAGYLVYSETFYGPVVLLVGILGVVLSDLILYAAGRQLASRARSPRGRFLSPRRLQRATRWFERLGHGAIFVARLAPGTRALVFVAAGARMVPIRTFVSYDIPGAALWVPAMLSLGFAFGSRIGRLHDAIGWLNRSAGWALAAAGLLLLLWLVWGREESKL